MSVPALTPRLLEAMAEFDIHVGAGMPPRDALRVFLRTVEPMIREDERDANRRGVKEGANAFVTARRYEKRLR